MQNGIVVYKIPFYSWWMIGVILFSIFIILLSTAVVKSIRNKKWVGLVGYSIGLIIFCWCLVGIVGGAIFTYNQTYKVYHAGGYHTVSGQIENMKVDSDSLLTRFSVDKVQFVLRDDMAGFSQRDFRANQKSNSSNKLKTDDFVTIKYVHSKYEWSRAGNKYIILYIEKNESH